VTYAQGRDHENRLAWVSTGGVTTTFAYDANGALFEKEDLTVVDVLVELLDDEEIAGHALIALRKKALPEARSAIEPFVEHPKTWIRNEARRALAKIDRKLAKTGEKQ